MNRYRTLVAVTSLAFAIALAGAAPRPIPSCAPLGALYSRKALRRIRTLLQLRLIELRAAQLRRARAVVVRAIPVDALLRAASSSQELAHEIEAGKLKHLARPGATICR